MTRQQHNKDSTNMTNFIGARIALWKNNSENENAPVLRGQIQDADGNTIADVAFWRNASSNENAPTLKGKISEPYAKKEGGSGQGKQEYF
jgi:hypothetical protein